MTDDQLQFDRVESGAAQSGGTVVCTSCGSPITDQYYSANGKVFCLRCKGGIEAALGARGNLGRGILFGLGAAFVGGVIYFAVTAISGYELSLITILIGWLVGRGVQKGSGAIGGRRYQVTAVLLTYLAVAGAYMGLGIRQAIRDLPAKGAVAPDSSAVTEPGPTSDQAGGSSSDSARPARRPSASIGLVYLIGFSLALPLVAGLSDLPGSLLGLLIIGIGLFQAWQMNRKPALAITGPFQIGSGEPPTA